MFKFHMQLAIAILKANMYESNSNIITVIVIVFTAYSSVVDDRVVEIL